MPTLRDPEQGGAVYGPGRALAWVTVGLMVLTLLYALIIVLDNWSRIRV